MLDGSHKVNMTYKAGHKSKLLQKLGLEEAPEVMIGGLVRRVEEERPYIRLVSLKLGYMRMENVLDEVN